MFVDWAWFEPWFRMAGKTGGYQVVSYNGVRDGSAWGPGSSCQEQTRPMRSSCLFTFAPAQTTATQESAGLYFGT